MSEAIALTFLRLTERIVWLLQMQVTILFAALALRLADRILVGTMFDWRSSRAKGKS